jgi:PAS domain S-box-containing protein
MKQRATTKNASAQIRELKTRLEEAEETLRAIRTGAVDALLVAGQEGDKVFTLEGADHPYRVFIEAMHEGAATLTRDGTVLYANRAFSELAKKALESIIGSSIEALIEEAGEARFASALHGIAERSMETEVFLKRSGEDPIPVRVSLTPLRLEGNSNVCIVVTDLTERKAAEETLRRSEKRLRYLSSELLITQEKERKRVANELHDSIAAALTAVKFGMERTLDLLEEGSPARDSLRANVSRAQRAIDETRRIMADLRPSILDDLGIVPAINWLCREFRTSYSDISLGHETDIQEEGIPSEVKTAIFRISQEALNNIGKHSHADQVNVDLRRTPEKLELTIRDNGKGFDLKRKRMADKPSQGFGLESMRERAELSGGSFSIESLRGSGTTIRAAWQI